jgi:hypothetical protein
MDPYVRTIVVKSRLIALSCLAIGAVVAVLYEATQYSKLPYAMALNMAPPQLP